MPWKQRSIVEERMRFVLRLKDGESMASLCREFGISRVTGYKIYGIPIAHIEGGEVSEGAIDDAVRNALTKMSHIHFTSTHEARQRLSAWARKNGACTERGLLHWIIYADKGC